jgi:hypothetical protein
MLKNAKGYWVENLPIKEDVWKNMMQETLSGVIRLLESAEKSLNNDVDVAICAGLYTYAVEEYGKLLLLKNCKPSSGMVEIRYKDWFRAHRDKFSIAIRNLPDECKTLHRGAFSRKNFSPPDFDTETVVDFEARLAIFYSDFTDRGEMKRVPPVDKDLLKKAISKFKTIAFGISIP